MPVDDKVPQPQYDEALVRAIVEHALAAIADARQSYANVTDAQQRPDPVALRVADERVRQFSDDAGAQLAAYLRICGL